MSELFPDYRSPWETDDQTLLRKHAAEFFRKEATPNQERWAAQHQVDRQFWTKAGAAGLLCLDIADEYGGGGGDFGHEAIVQQEISYALDTAFGFSVHSTIVAHYIAAYASEDQKKRWLPKCASGESVLAVAMTEPGTGSDLQAVRTTAVRDGDHYVINGSKTFISNASHCDLLVIVAKTDSTQGSKGISLLVAETENLPGFERGRVLDKIGQHGQDTRELSFTDMRVPAANLLGGVEGQGFYQLMGQLQRERLILGVSAVAVAEAAVAETVGFATQWDPQWFHIDQQAAEDGQFGSLIASGLHTLAILQRLTVVSAGRHWATIAGRGIRDLRFRSPVRPGDVLTGNVVIDDIVFDNRRRALVTTDSILVNGEGQVVLTVLIDAYLHARRHQPPTT
jgi:acyl-CoA dehydrogenase